MIVKLLVNLPRQAEKEPDSLVYLREIRVENNEQHNQVVEPSPLHQPNTPLAESMLVCQAKQRSWHPFDKAFMHLKLTVSKSYFLFNAAFACQF